MNPSPPKSGRHLEAQGSLVARLLSGVWRGVSTAPDISTSELSTLAQLLNATGDAALGWWRIRHSELATSEAGRQLHQAYRLFRLAALIHEQEIKYVFSLLRAERIEPVLVKGWAIARLYPDRGLRPYGDIDICVRPDRFAKAEQALKCLESLDGHYVDLHSGFAKLELWHGRPARGLHHGQDAHATLLWDKLFERSQLVSLGEERIRVLGGEDHLRILCLHLLRSGAWRPLWLCDVAVALETLAADFDWERCLGNDPKIAEWVACTIGLAQQLLGARSADIPVRLSAQREVPRWLAPAILRQWDRCLNPHAIEPALPALSARTRDAAKFFNEVYARWDQPVRATVAMRGRFNNWPRWPYQLGELLLHTSEVPKQLASMIVRRINELNSWWQRHRIGIGKEEARPRRRRIRSAWFLRTGARE